MLLTHPTLRTLFAAQALYIACTMIAITLTSLVGVQLAPLPGLATLPLALQVIGTLAATQPLSLFMQRHGRRAGLTLGAGAGLVGGLVAAAGVWVGDFAIFCLGAVLIGVYQGSAMFYRFAAIDAVEPERRGRATAIVLAGGVAAALAGPALALWSRDVLPVPFAGAYVLMAGLAAVGGLLMLGLPRSPAERGAGGGAPAAPAPRGSVRALLARPLVRAAMLTTAAGHGIMILVMNATPLAMQGCAHPVEDAATVIQWHMIGMFAPAFVSGGLVDRFGARTMAVIGAVVLSVSVGFALSGVDFAHFLVSSLLLGIGWNLMMVAGTALLGQAHAAEEKGQAQGLMELGNGAVAASASLASGVALVASGWALVNLVALPAMAVAILAVLTTRRRAALA